MRQAETCKLRGRVVKKYGRGGNKEENEKGQKAKVRGAGGVKLREC